MDAGTGRWQGGGSRWDTMAGHRAGRVSSEPGPADKASVRLVLTLPWLGTHSGAAQVLTPSSGCFEKTVAKQL